MDEIQFQFLKMALPLQDLVEWPHIPDEMATLAKVCLHTHCERVVEERLDALHASTSSDEILHKRRVWIVEATKQRALPRLLREDAIRTHLEALDLSKKHGWIELRQRDDVYAFTPAYSVARSAYYASEGKDRLLIDHHRFSVTDDLDDYERDDTTEHLLKELFDAWLAIR